MRSLDTCLTYSSALVITLITLSTPGEVQKTFQLVQSRQEPSERCRAHSEVGEAAMSAILVPLLTYDKLYPLDDPQIPG